MNLTESTGIIGFIRNRPSLFTRLQEHELGRNASWVLLGQGANFFVQTAYFLLLARLLGVSQYGVFAGVFALVNTVMPYSALGSGMLFMQYVNRDPAAAPSYWGYTLSVSLGMTLLIAGSLYFLGPGIIGSNDRLMIVSVTFSNCFFAQVVTCASRVFQTYEKLKVTALLSFFSNLIRLGAVVFMLALFRHATAREWSFALLAASVIPAGVAVLWVTRLLGSIKFAPGLIALRGLEGLGFAFAGSTQYAYNDLDKTMLNHYGLVAQAGFYTLAYRIVDFATTPIGSIDLAVLPRFFKLGQLGRQRVGALAVKTIRVTILLGLGVGVTLMLTLPAITHLVGKDFLGAVIVVKWICWLPLLRGIHQITGSAITGLGLQKYRTAAQVSVAVVNFALNVWLIPSHGWKGAAWSSLASDGLLSIINATLLICLCKRPNAMQPLLIGG